MRFTRYLTKAKNTHSEYVIIIALPIQRWQSECTPVLRYTNTVCPV